MTLTATSSVPVVRHDVKRGPSKWDLMQSVFTRQEVFFTVQPEKGRGMSGMITVVVTAVEQEDGSCESWLVKGYVVSTNAKFEGWFRTNQRSGYLDIEC